MVTIPLSRAVARPWDPAALEIATTLGFEEVQVTWVVTSTTELSMKVPWALNCWVAVRGSVTSFGTTVIETSTASVTVRLVLPVTPPCIARLPGGPVVRAVGVGRAVGSPGDPLLAIEATVGLVDDQLTLEVRT